MMEKICHHFFYYPKIILDKGDNYMTKQEKKIIQEERKIINETEYCEVYKAV